MSTQISGSVKTKGGDFVGRDKINITYVLKMSAFEPPADLRQLRLGYLDYLRRAYQALDFKGIPQIDTLSRQLALEEVYVPLLARPELPSGETWERRLAGRALGKGALPEDVLATLSSSSPAPAPVEQALAEKPRLVVLGDPGSGKTTLLKHLALRLAGEDNAPLPILLPLNAYAAALAQADINLQAYLPQYFAGLAQGIANLQPLFDAAIAQGQAVILLDGLDEVQSERARLVHKVETFAAEAIGRGCRLVVTSRIVGYRESSLAARDWMLYTLLDFDRQAIDAFAERWCRAFEISTLGDTPEARQAALVEQQSLLEAIDANPGVGQLACNPLLLTILALIKRQGVSLPNRRVELYELYLKTLITAWSKARALDKRPAGPPLDYLQTVAVLGPLALWLREENPTAGLVPEEQLIEWLTAYFKGEEWGLRQGEAMTQARLFLDSVRKYSNLLVERGQGRFGFMHLTFEEALAARGLVQLGQLSLQDSLVYVRKYLADPGWRETLLLAVGIWGLVREQPRVAGEVVRAMLQMTCEGEACGQNVLMAGACLGDVGEAGLGRLAAREVTEALLSAAHNRGLLPTVQRDAGFLLGRTGWAPADLDAFVSIPAGPFLYGDEKRKLVIEQPFSIARYPVTNLQYRRFIQAGGYEQREWWSEEGWAWRTGAYDSKATDEDLKRWLARRPAEERGEPFLWRDAKWNNPLAPVVGVCWFEAEAYCNWLAGGLGRPVRLPTEQEWERAARGVDGRAYPWGEVFDYRRLNCFEFWSGDYEAASTTMVGQFSEGNGLVGLSDMCGNTLEWTASWYEKEQVNRALRGGGWYNDREGTRCAYRGWDVPGLFDFNVGFRVVSPGIFLDSAC